MMNDEKWSGVSFTVHKLLNDGLSKVLPRRVGKARTEGLVALR